MSQTVALTGIELARQFGMDPIQNVFPIYAGGIGANETAGAAVSGPDGEPGAWAMDAGRCGTETVHDWFLGHRTLGDFSMLIGALSEELVGRAVYLPINAASHYASHLPSANIAIEHIYQLAPVPSNPHPTSCLTKLTPDLIGRLDVSDEMLPQVGTPRSFPKTEWFFGIVEGTELVGTVECMVQTSVAVAAEQVYIARHRRGRGLARRALSDLLNLSGIGGRALVMRVEETNAASISLAMSLGFQFHCEIAFAI